MRSSTDQMPTRVAERHLAAGRWTDAFELLHRADDREALDAGGLDLLARAAYGAGEFEVAITAWERAHALLVEEGHHTEAAGVAATIAMYLMMDTGLMAPVRGWLARAERLLEGAEASGVHAILAMVRTYERIMCGELEDARFWAGRAIELGTTHDAPAAAAIGRVAAARMHIFDGEVDEGLRLLDEAAVATVSGELDPLATGMVYCELICAMQGLMQFDRAHEWTEAMDRWRQGQAFGGINGRCRVHRAEMLRIRGACREAEEEALLACEELRPWMRREYGWPLTELGTIRLRRGDLDGAEEALRSAYENGWDPQPALAAVLLARGDARTAAQMLDAALSSSISVPSKERPPNEPLRRAPLLDEAVTVALIAGEPERARAAAAELARIASEFRSTALAAASALATARVALHDGELDAAINGCEEAVAGWCEVAAPYETAVARTVLADALRRDGRAELAEVEERLADDTFQAIGAVAPVSVADRAPSSLPSAVETTASFRRSGDTREIVYAGQAVQLHDLKGFRYLERLLASPGRELHVLDLVAGERGTDTEGSRTAADDGLSVRYGEDELGPQLDEQARAAYRRRLEEIDDDIAEAKRTGDLARVELAEADREFILAELGSAFGLGGRHRPVGAASERARTSVTRALRYALDRIAEHHPQLGDHLDRTVVTGTYCRYAPDPRVPIRWES